VIAAGLTTAGHEVDSAVDEGLGGAADDEVLFAAAAADRVLTLILQPDLCGAAEDPREMPLCQRECGLSKTAALAGEGHLPGESYTAVVRG